MSQKRRKQKGQSSDTARNRFIFKKSLAITIFSLFMILILSAGGLAVKVMADVTKSMDRMYQEVSIIDMRNSSIEVDDPVEKERPKQPKKEESAVTKEDLVSNAKPMAMLLIGTDTGDFGRTAVNGLSDTLIYVVLNPGKQRMSILSIPRDSYVEIYGTGTWTKINAAYSYGGAELCINTVQQLLQLPVDAYAVVNFKGFQNVIDAVGGVTVENSFTFSWDGFTFPEGTVTLNGEEALAFCRMRKNDPEGDFGRSRRQRDVIVAVAKKATTLAGALNYQELLDAVSGNVLTNVDMSMAMDMISRYSPCLNNVINHDTLVGYGFSNNGWYYQLDEANLAQVRQELREELELD